LKFIWEVQKRKWGWWWRNYVDMKWMV